MKACFIFTLFAFTQCKIPVTNFVDMTDSASVRFDGVTVSIGDTLTLLLKETPSTGFMWMLRISDIKEQGILGKFELAQS